MPQSPFEAEASVLGRYLLGEQPGETIVRLYVHAMETRSFESNARDEKRLRFALRNPWILGITDSALAFSQPKCLLRKKLLVLTAIIETQPQYASRFLPRERPGGYWIVIGLRLSWAVCKLVAGKIVLAFV